MSPPANILLTNRSAALRISCSESFPAYALSYTHFRLISGVLPSNTNTGFIPKYRSLSILRRNPSNTL